MLGVVGAAMSDRPRAAAPSVEALEALDVTERQPVVLSEPVPVAAEAECAGGVGSREIPAEAG